MKPLKICLMLSLILALLGCRPSDPEPTPEPLETVIATAAVEFQELGSDSHPVGEPFELVANFCDGRNYYWMSSSDMPHTVQVNFNREGEMESAVGYDGILAAQMRIARHSGLELGQTLSYELDTNIVSHTGRYTVHQVQAVETWRIGEIAAQVPLIGRQTVQYEVLVAVSLESISYEEIPCTDAQPQVTGTPQIVATPNATGRAPQVIVSEDFTDAEWFDNAALYQDFAGDCSYDSTGDTGRIISDASVRSQCAFSVMHPTGEVVFALSDLTHISVDVSIAAGRRSLWQGLRLSLDDAWWMTCSLRRVFGGDFVSVMETSAPANYNQYFVAPSNSITITLSIEGETIVCTHDGLRIGSIPLSQLPSGASQQQVSITIESNRPAGEVVTTIDNLTISQSAP